MRDDSIFNPDSNTSSELSREQQLLWQNRVIVRIWTSGNNLKTRGDDVGHISLQTQKRYMSLWPKKEMKELDGLLLKYFQANSHDLKASPEWDAWAEEREPEIIYVLYNLDSYSIVDAFDEIMQTLKGWSLIALSQDTESCASLAYRLLECGGIRKYIDTHTQKEVSKTGSLFGVSKSSENSLMSSEFVISGQFKQAKEKADDTYAASYYSVEMGIGTHVKSPDFCAELLKTAKQAELKQSPSTAPLSFKGETPVSVPQSHSPKKN